MAAILPIHKLLEQHRTFILPGVYDPLGAKLAEIAGFEILFVSGYSVAATHLGVPDLGLLTQTEIVGVAKRICQAVSVPVIVDADTGYGNALNVVRTVNELIDAGAAGMILEDQIWPKRCGHMQGKRVIPPDEHAQKIRAAVEARGDRDFFLIARTDARQAHGLDDAIARCRRYKDAGADALSLEAALSRDELQEVARALPPPLVCNTLDGGVTPLLSRSELEALGFSMMICSLTGLYAAAKALQDIFQLLHQSGTSRTVSDRLISSEQFNQLIELDAYNARDARYRIPE